MQDFFAFDAFKRLLGEEQAIPSGAAASSSSSSHTFSSSSSHFRTFLAAGLAGTTSWVALYPLEVLRSRVTVGGCVAAAEAAARAAAGGRLGVVAQLRAVVQCEGIGALYKGLGPSVLAIFPEAAITYG